MTDLSRRQENSRTPNPERNGRRRRSQPDPATGGAARTNHRENCFDFLRLFAASCVVIHHSTRHLNMRFLWLRPGGTAWFYDGVPLFFVLSGMLVYQSADRCLAAGRSLREYLLNRFLRVAPALYAYTLITSGLLVIIGAVSLATIITPQFGAWLTSNFLLAPIYRPAIFAAFGSGDPNGSLWTIPVEVSFYLFVPLAVLLERQRGRAALFVSLGALTLVGLVFAPSQSIPGSDLFETTAAKLMHYTFLPHLVFFGMGIVWLRFWDNVPKSRWVAALCLAVYGAVRYTSVWPNSVPLRLVLWGVPFSYLVIWVGRLGPSVLRGMTTRIGDISFGVYIWHMVVINLIIYWGLVKGAPPWADSLVNGGVLVVSVVLGLVSWWFLEKRVLRRKRYTSRTL